MCWTVRFSRLVLLSLPPYRNSKIHIRVEVTQSEDDNFLKSTIV